MSENATQEPKESQNTASAPEDLEAIKTQLEEAEVARNEANQAKTAAEQTIAQRDARLAELQAEGEALRAERSNLQTSLSEAKQASKEKLVELASLGEVLSETKELKDQAVAKYLNMAKALNPAVPQDIIAGETIEEIDQSIEKGKAIVEAVKATMASETAATKVPAGAPTRGGISLEGLSPRDKIAYAIQQGSQR
jgi:chromosome segregation ATPase